MIAIGCRFDDRLTGNPKTFAKNAKVVHIDVDPNLRLVKLLQWTFQLLVMLSKPLEMLLAEPVVQNNTENGLKKSPKTKNVYVLTIRKNVWYSLRQLSSVSVN